MAYQSVNPFDGSVEPAFAEHSPAEVNAALAVAQACFDKWRQALLGERAAVVARAEVLVSADILNNIHPGNPAYRDELFGPVALFFRVNDEGL